MPILRTVRYSIAKSPVHQPLTWIRHRGLRPSDVFVASYPRSGNTWLRFMLYEILVGQSSSFTNVHQLVPDVGRQGKALPVLPEQGRLIKTHEAYLPLYHKAIYLVRDARDVALSEFAYQKALGLAEDNFETYLPRFLAGKVNPFGSWIAHVDSWMEAKDKGQAEVLLVRFDEMRSRPEDSLANMMEFLNVPVERDVIRRAVANNSVEKMRDKEKINPQKASAKGRFIRSGAVGGWREKFTETQAELVEKYAGNILSRLGFAEVESVSR
jgi:hypothetical protein